MKGLVFTEFLNQVEEQFGLETLDKVLYSSNLNLKSGGVYTAVGTYPHSELIGLVQELSKEAKIPVPELLKSFGKYLFTVFEKNYGSLFLSIRTSLDLLEKVESYIHVEVQKLYPDAELPTLEKSRISENCLLMVYKSNRRLADFAEGLILGCAEYFGERLSIIKEDLSNGEGREVKFTISKI
ncbi:Guanylate cyclase-related protein [Fulvivirga imtechensis AK7]|uniref:Guanylate cyclase-related protein n=1 Tax=Fulvivirga imtechensis AK7 TaxID=1237149 RepID=L8JWA4_9BACT|nr:heme NO-binding domain-containing protein [Fulvivirga imtechensis]ELR73075.1 Guanylate cyclase-related protein [Fulvivirga imtechensis AK7]